MSARVFRHSGRCFLKPFPVAGSFSGFYLFLLFHFRLPLFKVSNVERETGNEERF
jgi:hypothetical protein